jgi:hypothetical protein
MHKDWLSMPPIYMQKEIATGLYSVPKGLVNTSLRGQQDNTKRKLTLIRSITYTNFMPQDLVQALNAT